MPQLMIYLFYYMIRINMLPPGKSLSPEQICPFLIELLFTIICLFTKEQKVFFPNHIHVWLPIIKRFLFFSSFINNLHLNFGNLLMIYLFYYMIRINMLPPGKSLSPEQICPFLIELLFTIICLFTKEQKVFFPNHIHVWLSHVCNPLQHVESLLQILYAIFLLSISISKIRFDAIQIELRWDEEGRQIGYWHYNIYLGAFVLQLAEVVKLYHIICIP
ncbi:hypothetical protein ACJX0J_014982 [Zea mays]